MRGCVALAAVALAGCATVEPAAVPSRAVPPAMQWLYGSGEAAAASVQAYRAVSDYVTERARERPAGGVVESVVLAADATLAAPRFVPCGTKPLAMVLDVDETALLNLGYEYDEAAGARSYDAARWERWERTGGAAVAAVPGAADALEIARKFGLTVVFNSNRGAANAAFTARQIEGAGLGPAVHGETLFLKGDDATGSRKDARRARIAERYCVVALVGDQLGDFSDLFNQGVGAPPARRAAAVVNAKWGRGWFLLPNPVYGTGVAGSFDEVFPADRRWTDPGPAGE